MGILDGMHAATHAGEAFVWLHSMATLLGGAFISLVWFSPIASHQSNWHMLYVAVFLAVTIGTAAVIVPEIHPQMLVGEEFSVTAQALNIGGGMLFYVAAIYFLRRNQNVNDLLFGILCTLFGSAGILFELSMVWDAAWWW